MNSPNDVIDHHLKAIEQGDVHGVLSDHAADAVLLKSDGAFTGHDAIRRIFEALVAEFQTRGTTTTTKQRLVAGSYGYMLWSGETADNVYELAADTFVIRDGKIVLQSFTAKVNRKEPVSEIPQIKLLTE